MLSSHRPVVETATNYALFVPAKTPADIVARLSRGTNAVLQVPEVVDKLTSLGIVVTGGSTEAAVARTAIAVAKWAGVIRKGNLQLN
jgi:tripartite-type tricarboxylate transporter receptor subunit TctC